MTWPVPMARLEADPQPGPRGSCAWPSPGCSTPPVGGSG